MLTESEKKTEVSELREEHYTTLNLGPTHPATHGVFQNILQANPSIDALFACNDLMALGAVEAIGAAGKSGKILVVGFDAQPEARAAIQKGTMAATVAQFPARMGAIAVENAARLLRGETIETFSPVSIELIK